MNVDYRKYEHEAIQLEKRVAALTSKATTTPAERDEVCSLMGEVHALSKVASEAKDAELRELRQIAKNGDALGDYSSPDVDAFYHFMRTRDPQNLTTGDSGQYVVPAGVLAPVQEVARRLSPIFAGATQLDISGGAAEAELPLKTHGVAAHASETGTRSEQTAASFASATVVARDIYSDQRPSSTWLDSVPGAPEMLTRWLIEDLYETFAEDVAIGTGTDRADGLFAATSTFTVVPSGFQNAMVNTLPMAMIGALEPRFLPDAVFLCNGATLGVLSAMAMPSSVNSPLINWDAGKPTLYGIDVLIQSSAPSIGDGAHPLALANLANAYLVGVHRQPGVLVDPFTVSNTGKIRYLASWRVGGVPWNPGACILGKSDAS